jgi:LPS export ABC transporter protein LptC
MNLFAAISPRVVQATPIFIMGVLALASFSLLKSSSIQVPDLHAPIHAHIDYYLNQFSTAHLNDSGELKSFIRGRYSVHSLTTKSTLIDDFIFTSASKKNLYRGQSDLADFNDDANTLILRQNAILHRTSILNSYEPRTTLKSNHLLFTQYPEKLVSETPVHVEQGNRTTLASFMYYDSDSQIMQLNGGVKIKVKPTLISQ